jgi:hypothetical protein
VEINEFVRLSVVLFTDAQPRELVLSIPLMLFLTSELTDFQPLALVFSTDFIPEETKLPVRSMAGRTMLPVRVLRLSLDFEVTSDMDESVAFTTMSAVSVQLAPRSAVASL